MVPSPRYHASFAILLAFGLALVLGVVAALGHPEAWQEALAPIAALFLTGIAFLWPTIRWLFSKGRQHAPSRSALQRLLGGDRL